MKKNRIFGRNLATLLLIVGSILFICLVVFLIYWPIEANNKKSKMSVSPFGMNNYNETIINNLSNYKAGSIPSELSIYTGETSKPISYTKFDKIDVTVKCTKYLQDGNAATFTISIKWNSTTAELVNAANGGNGTLIPDSSGYTVYAGIALASSEVGFLSYSTSTLKYKLVSSSSSDIQRTTEVKGLSYFPKTINSWPMMWPFNAKKSAPDAYVFVHFSYMQSGKTINENHILKYSYKDYVTSDTQGGIQ